jgi:hypothetical protein
MLICHSCFLTGCGSAPPYTVIGKIFTQSYTNMSELLCNDGTIQRNYTIQNPVYIIKYCNMSVCNKYTIEVTENIFNQYQVGEPYYPPCDTTNILPEEPFSTTSTNSPQ